MLTGLPSPLCDLLHSWKHTVRLCWVQQFFQGHLTGSVLLVALEWVTRGVTSTGHCELNIVEFSAELLLCFRLHHRHEQNVCVRMSLLQGVEFAFERSTRFLQPIVVVLDGLCTCVEDWGSDTEISHASDHDVSGSEPEEVAYLIRYLASDVFDHFVCLLLPRKA